MNPTWSSVIQKTSLAFCRYNALLKRCFSKFQIPKRISSLFTHFHYEISWNIILQKFNILQFMWMQILLTCLPKRNILLCVNSFSFMASYVLNRAGSLPRVGERSVTNAVLHKMSAIVLDRLLLAQELSIWLYQLSVLKLVNSEDYSTELILRKREIMGDRRPRPQRIPLRKWKRMRAV